MAETREGEEWRGKVGRMAGDEVSAFLDEPHIARLACLDDEGWPYVVPCWQEWDGASFWVIPRARSAWAAHLKRDPRCAITVDEAGTQRKVIAKCRAHLVEEAVAGADCAWVPIATRMSVRYLGEHGPDYLGPTLDKPRWLFRLEPVSVTTWQGNDWAKKYG